ncbi:MAG: hypothetical protein ACOZBZ_00195 [Patescibacteria group bacterium]
MTEFDRRLDEGRIFPLDVLFEAAMPLASSSLVTKGDKRLYKRIVDAIERHAPSAPLEEVVNAFEKYAGSQLDLNVDLLDVLLSCRDDADTIVSAVIASASDKKFLILDMEQRKIRAGIIRDRRKNKV